MFEKVGGIEPVNQLMQSYGLKTIQATGTADRWFKAVRAAPDAATFHREGKTPFGLSSAREMGRLLEMIERGEAVSKSASEQMLQIAADHARPGVQLAPAEVCDRISRADKTGDFLPHIANDVVLERGNRRVVISVFMAHHYGIGAQLEDAIGRVSEQVADYFNYQAQ